MGGRYRTPQWVGPSPWVVIFGSPPVDFGCPPRMSWAYMPGRELRSYIRGNFLGGEHTA